VLQRVDLQKVPSMRVELVLPAAQKLNLVLEAVGDDTVRINSSSPGFEFAQTGILEFGRKISVDLEADADFDKCWGSPSHAHPPLGSWQSTLHNQAP
jgi:hypothetical protein